MFMEHHSVDELFRSPSRTVFEFVKQHYDAIDCSREWQDLAEGASSIATCNDRLGVDATQEWATIAVLVFDRLGRMCDSPSEQYYYEEAAMSLRSFMIDKFGPESHHLLLDPETVENWFFRRLTIAYPDAILQSRNAAELPTDAYVRLCSLKDRLRVIRPLYSKGLIRQADDLSKWYDLLEPGS